MGDTQLILTIWFDRTNNMILDFELLHTNTKHPKHNITQQSSQNPKMDQHFVRYLPESYAACAYEMLFNGSYEVPTDMHAKGYDLMTYAAHCGHNGVIRCLVIDHLWDMNKRSPVGFNALYAASLANRRVVVEQLLYWQADITLFQGKREWTALMEASSQGHSEIVNLFIQTRPAGKQRIDLVNMSSPLTGETALHCAAANGHVRVVSALIAASSIERIWHRTKRGVCALDLAIRYGHQDLAAKMLNSILSSQHTFRDLTRDLSHSLMMAVYYHRQDIVLPLLKAGARSMMTMKGGVSPLMAASLKNNLHILTLCINHASLYTPYDVSMPLYFANREGNVTVAERLTWLLSPDKIIYDGHTLLCMAAEKQHEFWVVSLLKFGGVDINKQDDDDGGETLLYKVAAKGKHAMVKILLDLGANPLLTNSQGLTPMYKAASLNHMSTVKCFLDAGVDVNCYDHPNHLTALFVACCAGYKDMVDLLMNAGAFPLLETKPLIMYRNAYEAAKAMGDAHISERLQQYVDMEKTRVTLLMKARYVYDTDANARAPAPFPDHASSNVAIVVTHVVYSKCFGDDLFRELVQYF